MEFTAQLDNFNTKLWSYHVKVPRDIAAHFINSGHKRVVVTLNQQVSFQAAIMPAGNGIHFINVNKKLRDQLKIKEGSRLNIALTEDTSEYGLPFPEELKEILSQDKEGDRLFHELTPGKQRNLIYAVNQVKHPDLRIQRGLIIIEHLKRNKGKIVFKELYRELHPKA